MCNIYLSMKNIKKRYCVKIFEENIFIEIFYFHSEELPIQDIINEKSQEIAF